MACSTEQKIYEGQTALQIQANTCIDLTSGQTFAIKYRDPDGVTGSWPASVVGGATEGVIGTDTPPTLAAGLWTAWAHVTFADASVAPGDIFTFTVFTEGE